MRRSSKVVSGSRTLLGLLLSHQGLTAIRSSAGTGRGSGTEATCHLRRELRCIAIVAHHLGILCLLLRRHSLGDVDNVLSVRRCGIHGPRVLLSIGIHGIGSWMDMRG